MKRTKIIASICASLLCLSALVMAVYAVISSSFAVKTTLTFDPNGLYVSVRGQVYRGDSLENMAPLTTKESYTLSTTNSSNTSDAAEAAEMRAWEPDVVNFLPSEKYVQFRLFVSNKGEQDVSFIPKTDISIDGLKVIEEASDTLRIASNETKEYKLTFYLTTDEEFELKEFSASHEFSLTSEVEISSVSSSTGWTGIQYAVFSNSVTSLTSGARSGASSLKAVHLSNKLTTLPSSLFSGCTSLTSVTIPEGVRTISSSAFNGCTSLMSITIPSSVTSIQSSSFAGCSSLKYIKMSGNTLSSTYTLPTTSGKVWVKSETASEPTDWTNNVVADIPTSAGNLYYHQQAACDKLI